ncbi:hypothetical protein H6G56_07340 [Anabaena variabilis FACHB-164]|nr:hypothetical protein [Trichormus variabilis FACHB-164]
MALVFGNMPCGIFIFLTPKKMGEPGVITCNSNLTWNSTLWYYVFLDAAGYTNPTFAHYPCSVTLRKVLQFQNTVTVVWQVLAQ